MDTIPCCFEIDRLTEQLITAQALTKKTSHCQLNCGETVGNYDIGTLLGRGRFAAVWSAVNIRTGDEVAIKVYRRGSGNSEYFENEVKILNCIFEQSALSKMQPPNIIGYLGAFAHVTISHDKFPNIYPCVLFNLAGDSISKLLKYCAKSYGNGIPMNIVKKIMRAVLQGLEYMHSNGIVHTDIKPGNILMSKKIGDINGDDFDVYIGDLGSSSPENDLFTLHVGTTQYCAPELLLEEEYTTAVDIWALFASCYEMITGDLIFDVFKECKIEYGDDVDNEATDGIQLGGGGDSDDNSDFDGQNSDEDASDCPADCTGCEKCCGNCCDDDLIDGGNGAQSSLGAKVMSLSSGDGDEDDSEDPEKVNYRHFLLMEKVLGHPSKGFTSKARVYYNARGKLKNNPAITPIGIVDLLVKNYEMDPEECRKIEEFLITGFKFMPSDRITAAVALQHPWLV